MVDAADSKSVAARRAGSSPAYGTRGSMAYAYANDENAKRPIEVTLPANTGGNLTIAEAKLLIGDLQDAIAQAEDNARYNALTPNERWKEMLRKRTK